MENPKKKRPYTHIKQITLFLFCFLIAVACKKEQPNMTPLNQNCDCAQEVTADFYMEEMGTSIDWKYERHSTDTDTMYANKNIWFHPVEKNAEYTWYLGLETLHEAEIYRHFGEEHIGHTYPMTLVVRKKPNTICFPNDDGYDSIVRYLTITDKYELSLFYSNENHMFSGVFRLKDSIANSDSVDIQVTLKGLGEDGIGYERIIFKNIDGNNSIHTATEGEFGDLTYRQVWFSLSAYKKLRFWHKIDGKRELELIPQVESAEYPHYYFKGRKLY